jgi:hypothetical protein
MPRQQLTLESLDLTNRWDLAEVPSETEQNEKCAARYLMHMPREPHDFFTVDDPAALAEAFHTFSRQMGPKLEIDFRIGILEKVVLEMRHALTELASQKTIHVSVTSLEPEPFILSKPISIVVQQEGDEFSATYFDANINASGDTQTEAVANLKEMLVSIFRRFGELGMDRLGPALRKQYAVLKSVIEDVK